jgi:RNA polymerase sigma factor (sigma-70 family)
LQFVIDFVAATQRVGVCWKAGMTAFDSQYDLVNQDDAVLLQRFTRSRDEEAFAAIVQRYTGPVYATCKRVLGSRSLAEEASQEAFLRLLKQPEKIRQSLGGWLHRTATTISIDMIRRDSSRRVREMNFVAAPRDVSRWDDLSPLIDEALAELPDDDCNLLVQHFIRGRSQRELAQELQVSPASMSRRMHAALDGLREQLRKRGVAVAIAALAFMLATSAVEAAPPELAVELGKMSMVSGSQSLAASLTGGSGAGAAGAAATTGGSTLATVLPLALAVMVVLAAGGVISIGMMMRSTTPLSTPLVANPQSNSPSPRDQVMDIYVLPMSLDNVGGQRVHLFESPAASTDNMVTVVFTDSHVERIGVAALAELIVKQTGKPLAVWTDQNAPRRTTINALASQPPR